MTEIGMSVIIEVLAKIGDNLECEDLTSKDRVYNVWYSQLVDRVSICVNDRDWTDCKI